MSVADVVWGGLLAVGAVVEVYALLNGRDGDTLSEKIRLWLGVRKQPGRAIFAAGWLVFSIWFLGHVLWGW